MSVSYLKNQRRWQCSEKHPRRQFSAKVGTIFEESPLGLDKWFVAIWCITNAKNGISSCELARALGVTQKSAWFMLHRVRHAMHTGSFEKKLCGTVESDETFVGGKSANMHLSRRREKIHGTGGMGKAVVHGLIERGDKRKKGETKEERASRKFSKVRASVVADTKKSTLVPIVTENVAAGANVYTDSLASYNALAALYVHEAVLTPNFQRRHHLIFHRCHESCLRRPPTNRLRRSGDFCSSPSSGQEWPRIIHRPVQVSRRV
jgi:hypothetical protein